MGKKFLFTSESVNEGHPVSNDAGECGFRLGGKREVKWAVPSRRCAAHTHRACGTPIFGVAVA
jgi:hypothetical protein